MNDSNSLTFSRFYTNQVYQSYLRLIEKASNGWDDVGKNTRKLEYHSTSLFLPHVHWIVRCVITFRFLPLVFVFRPNSVQWIPYKGSNKMKYATRAKIARATKPCQRGREATPNINVSNDVIIAIKSNVPAVFPDSKMNLLRMKTTIISETAALTWLNHLECSLKVCRLITWFYQEAPNGWIDVGKNRQHTSKGLRRTILKSSCFCLTSNDLFGVSISLGKMFYFHASIFTIRMILQESLIFHNRIVLCNFALWAIKELFAFKATTLFSVG